MKTKKIIVFGGVIFFLILSGAAYWLQSSYIGNMDAQFFSNLIVCISTAFFVAAAVDSVNMIDVHTKGLKILLKSNESLYYFAKQLEINSRKAEENNRVIPESWCVEFADKLNNLCERIDAIDDEFLYRNSNNIKFVEYQQYLRSALNSFKIIKNELHISWINLRLDGRDKITAQDVTSNLDKIIAFTKDFAGIVDKAYLDFAPRQKLNIWNAKKQAAVNMLNNYKEDQGA